MDFRGKAPFFASFTPGQERHEAAAAMAGFPEKVLLHPLYDIHGLRLLADGNDHASAHFQLLQKLFRDLSAAAVTITLSNGA